MIFLATVVICLVLAAAFVLGVRKSVSRMSSGCCGAGDAPKRMRVKDKVRSHYPYAAKVEIGGMSCRNCAVRVENALNSVGGVWAKVDLEHKEAAVRLKENLSDEQLAEPIREAGYSVGKIVRV